MAALGGAHRAPGPFQGTARGGDGAIDIDLVPSALSRSPVRCWIQGLELRPEADGTRWRRSAAAWAWRPKPDVISRNNHKQ